MNVENNIAPTKYSIIYHNSTYTGIDKVDIQPTDDGYDFINNNKVLFSLTTEKDIKHFVEQINKWVRYKAMWVDSVVIDDGTGETVSLVFDNTYSYRNEKLDNTLPKKRLEEGINYLQKEWVIQNGTTGKLWWLFSLDYWTPEVHMNDEVFTYKIDESWFDTYIVPLSDKSEAKMQYVPTKFKLVIDHIDLKVSYWEGKWDMGCRYNNEYDIVCRTEKDFYDEIEKIYNTKYATGDEKHYGTFLLDYLYTKDFYQSNNIYIFTDGEFQISKDTSSQWLAKINTSYKQNKTMWFDAVNYNKNLSWFPEYWTMIAKTVQGKIVMCDNNLMTFVGITSDSAPFIHYLKDFYSKELFQGCEITFK